jgi:hypothetical protein
LQKAYDTEIREALWWKLSKKRALTKFIEEIKAMYTDVNKQIRKKYGIGRI